jgi:hypothetical protein
MTLVHEYRPSMDAEVLHSWAKDAVARIAELEAALEEANDTPAWDALKACKAKNERLRTRIAEIEALVERAFRDGIAYASNVSVKDADLAWEQSQVRAALAKEPSDADA